MSRRRSKSPSVAGLLAIVLVPAAMAIAFIVINGAKLYLNWLRRWPLPTLVGTALVMAASSWPQWRPLFLIVGLGLLFVFYWLRRNDPYSPPGTPQQGGDKTYFIQDTGSGLIKIGKTSRDQLKRLADLQTAHHAPLALLATTTADERALHAHFQHLHQRGEWYRPGPDLLAFIGRPEPAPQAPPQASPDGRHWWDGRTWTAVSEARAALIREAAHRRPLGPP